MHVLSNAGDLWCWGNNFVRHGRRLDYRRQGALQGRILRGGLGHRYGARERAVARVDGCQDQSHVKSSTSAKPTDKHGYGCGRYYPLPPAPTAAAAPTLPPTSPRRRYARTSGRSSSASRRAA